MFQLDFGLQGFPRTEYHCPDFRSELDRRDIEYLLLTRWEEHCLECSAPDCFTSCPLYRKREDFMCQRFDYGIVANKEYRGLLDYGADMQFRRWGKLEAALVYAPVRHETLVRITQVDDVLLRVVRPLTSVTNRISTIRKFNPGIIYNTLKKKILRRINRSDAPGWDFDEFVVEAVNPGDKDFNLNVELLRGSDPVYKTSMMMGRGYNIFRIPYADMNIDLRELTGYDARIAIYPSDDYQARIIFTWLTFVKYKRGRYPPAIVDAGTGDAPKKIKCVVWDLDETLWHGILVEDGSENIRLRQECVSMIKELDRRGIVQTIASKNDHDAAWDLVRSFNLDSYFIYPAINWQPKSASISSVARDLGIHLDTFAFIDDSAFERAEVSHSIPEVRVYSPDDVGNLLEQPEFDVIVTEESRNRRIMYQHEASRKMIASNYGGSHEDFLKSCMMELTIERPLEDSHFLRCYELVQRTNQLNISGYRYSYEEFRSLAGRDDRISLMLSCADRFGSYGIVGYVGIEHVDNANSLLIRDLVISCRVARKKVEHALFRWVCDYCSSLGCDTVCLRFVPTSRNSLIKDALLDVGFRVKWQDEQETILFLDSDSSIPGSDIVRIVDKYDRA